MFVSLRRALPFTLAGLSALLFSLPAAAASTPGAKDVKDAKTRRFEQLVHDYYERYLATHPEDATQLGDHLTIAS